ncbi:MAG: HlyD family secretion protein [Mariniblastus sp.]
MKSNRTNNPSGKASGFEKRTAAIHLVQSSRSARRLAKLLLVGLVLSIVAMGALPWQQTSRGTGEVVAYAPQERQQSVKAQMKGVVAEIAPGLFEGKVVKQGDFLLKIQPFSANMIEQLNAQRRELKLKEETANTKAESYQSQITGLTEAMEFGINAAKQMISAAEAKLKSKQNQVSGYESKEWQARMNYERQEGLRQKKLKPAKDVEKLKFEWEMAKSNLESLGEDIAGLKNELTAKQQELEEKRRTLQVKISYAEAMKADAEGGANTIRKEILDVQMKLDTIARGEIRAPRDGTVFRLNVNERGDSVKEGDSLLTIVPEITQKAVEIYVNGNDMPLVQIGQEVRLQFEGWPAVQFAGWPSVSIGTFSGRVATVDATDNGKGEFRILITPNEDEQKWPSDRYLRQGVRANGWVMMRRVSLGYEIWRQLNGFPIILSEEEPKKKGKSAKPPKLPK